MVEGDDWLVKSKHCYPVRALAGDYIRTSIGLFLTAGPLILLDVVDALKVVLFLLLIVFLIFGFRTIIRQATTVMLCDKGIRTAGRFASEKLIAWREMRYLKLKYFSTRRDQEAGWMQLRLGGDGVQLSLDSAIDGFEEIVAQATGFAGVAGLSLETTTMENLNAMGLMPVETADDDMADDRAFVNKDAHSR
jgi:hypothetical protein